MKPIRTSKAVAMEIFEWMGNATCGHGGKLSPRARRVYRKWRLASFKPNIVWPGMPDDAWEKPRTN